MSEVNNEATAIEATPRVLTDEENAKIAKLAEQIAKITAKIEAIKAGKPEKAAKAEAYVPAVGAPVIATIGRNTAKTQAKLVEGVVTAVKLGETGADGKTSATQVRVRINAGTFEEQLVTLYPAQLKPNPAKMEDNITDDRAIGEQPSE